MKQEHVDRIDVIVSGSFEMAAIGEHLPVDLGPIRLSARQAWGFALEATAATARGRLGAARRRLKRMRNR